MGLEQWLYLYTDLFWLFISNKDSEEPLSSQGKKHVKSVT